MISTAAYYCNQGHVWTVTTSTWGHEAVLTQPCLTCMMSMEEGEKKMFATPHGPFSSEEAARKVMEFRKSERAGR